MGNGPPSLPLRVSGHTPATAQPQRGASTASATRRATTLTTSLLVRLRTTRHKTPPLCPLAWPWRRMRNSSAQGRRAHAAATGQWRVLPTPTTIRLRRAPALHLVILHPRHHLFSPSICMQRTKHLYAYYACTTICANCANVCGSASVRLAAECLAVPTSHTRQMRLAPCI